MIRCQINPGDWFLYAEYPHAYGQLETRSRSVGPCHGVGIVLIDDLSIHLDATRVPWRVFKVRVRRKNPVEHRGPYGAHVFTRVAFPCITLDRNTSIRATEPYTWPRYISGVSTRVPPWIPFAATGVVKIVDIPLGISAGHQRRSRGPDSAWSPLRINATLSSIIINGFSGDSLDISGNFDTSSVIRDGDTWIPSFLRF